MVIAILLCCTTRSWCNTIVYPWRSSSAIRTPGETLAVLYDGNDLEEMQDLELIGPYSHVKLDILDWQYGSFVYDEISHDPNTPIATTSNLQAATNWKIITRIPEGTTRDLYDLRLTTSLATTTSPRSVQVIKEYKTQYTFVHITDTHVGREFYDGYGNELQYLEKIIEVVNIIAPEFVLCTGDCIMNYSNPDHNETFPLADELWSNFYEGAQGHAGIKSFDVPTFVSPGNHDYRLPRETAISQWHRYCGLRQQGFRYGDGAYILLDDYLGGYSELDDWPTLQTDWAGSWLNTLGDYSFLVLGIHDPASLPLGFCNTYGVNLALCGHEHKNMTRRSGTTPTQLAMTGSASYFNSDSRFRDVGWFRIMTVDGNSVTTEQPVQYGNPSTGEMNFTLEYANSNNGSACENTATIANGFEMNVPECRIRFVMAPGEYTIDNGTIEQAFHQETVSIYDVRVDAPAGIKTRQGRGSYVIVKTPTQVNISPKI